MNNWLGWSRGWSWVCFPLVAVAVGLPGGTALRAQQTTGNVAGVVRDTTGAIVPQATVTLRDTASGSERKTTSNSSGEFTIPSVAAALSYQLSVTETGFDTWQSRPFPLRPGDQITFTDIKLAIGAVSTDVTVEDVQSQAVKPLDTPERADVITAKDLETLAIQGRDATELIRFLPGFSLISPGLNNQAPNDAVVGVSSASTGSYSSNGTGSTGIATILDGTSLTDVRTNAGTTQTINPEMVSEIKVTTSTYSADYAHGPTVIDATTKSGGLKFHGSAYLYARNAALNANDWYNNFLQLPRPEGRYFYPGATLGGPLWIPGTRFQRDTTRLFFFAGFEVYNQLYSPQTLGSWVPTIAERNGDFSVASLNAQLCGARPDGKANPNSIQPMCNAENYLPSGGFNAPSVQNGNLKGLGNPSGIALLNWMPLPNADPFTNIDGYNYIQEVIQHQNGNGFHARLDYAINDSNKLAITYGRQSQVTQDPVSYGNIAPNSVLYPGQISSGDISNVFSLTYTRVFSPSVVNEFGLGYSVLSSPGNEGNPAAVGRFTTNSYNCSNPAARAAGTCGSSGNGNFSYLGEFKYAGDYSIPDVQDYSNLGYPNIQVPGGFYNNQIHQRVTVPDVTETVSLQRGRHAIKLGLYYETGIVNGLAVIGLPQGQYTFNPQNTYFDYSNSVGTASQFQTCVSPDPAGNNRLSGAAYLGACMTPNALMYLGYADSYTQENFSPDVDMRYTTLAGFANDSWHIKHFTFQLGMRFEHLGTWTDRHGNGLAQFSSALYLTQCAGAVCGSANAPGVSWHGVDGSIPNSVSQPTMVYASPRLGLAWDLLGTGNTVLRGGWGIYRHQEEFAPYAAAAATAQGFKTTYQQNTLTFDSVEQQSPINPADFNIDTLSQADTRRPVYYEYNAAISQRLHFGGIRNSLVEVAYVGNNSQHLSSYNSLAQGYNEISDINFIPAGTLFNTGTVSRIQGAVNSIASLTTNQLDSVRQFPFYQHIFVLNHNLYSNYNSLQASWNKNDGPVQFGVNYTFSKNLAIGQTYGTMVADATNLRNDYTPTPSDRTNIFNAHYLIDFGKRYKGDHRGLGLLENGWQLSGISTRQSGPPLASLTNGNFGFGYGVVQPVQVYDPVQAPAGSNTTCSTVYGIKPDKNGNTFCVNNVNPVVWLGTPDLLLQPTVNCNPGNTSGTHQFVNPTCLGIPVPGGPATGSYALSSNPSGQGQYRLPYIHGPAFMRHDLTLLKNIGVGGEGRNLQLRFAAFNFLNNPQVSFNNNDTSNLTLAFQGATVGQPLTQSSLTHQNFGNAGIKYGARVLELSAHYQF